MVNVVSFDNVEVLRVDLNNPFGANTLFLVCGVAVINFHGPLNDYNRDTVTFLVPNEGQTDPNDPALDVGLFRDSTVIAFPATIEASPERPVGWGVDNVDTIEVNSWVLVLISTAVKKLLNTRIARLKTPSRPRIWLNGGGNHTTSNNPHLPW